MFLLRYRNPTCYGKFLDGMEARQSSEGPTSILALLILRMLRASWIAFNAAWDGEPARDTPPEFFDRPLLVHARRNWMQGLSTFRRWP